MFLPHVYRPGEGLFLWRMTALVLALLAATGAARLSRLMAVIRAH